MAHRPRSPDADTDQGPGTPLQGSPPQGRCALRGAEGLELEDLGLESEFCYCLPLKHKAEDITSITGADSSWTTEATMTPALPGLVARRPQAKADPSATKSLRHGPCAHSFPSGTAADTHLVCVMSSCRYCDARLPTPACGHSPEHGLGTVPIEFGLRATALCLGPPGLFTAVPATFKLLFKPSERLFSL